MAIGQTSQDLPSLLQESIPNRFMNLTPNQFEDFIVTLFKDMGYTSELTPRSNDYGGDVLAQNESEKIIIQVKRYNRNNTVGVQDINQVIGAKQYYKADKAMIITTSKFSRNGKRLANQTDVELWDWSKLISKIRENYLDGQTVYEYFEDQEQIISENMVREGVLEFQVVKVIENCRMRDGSKCTVVHFKIRNLSDEIVKVRVVSFPNIIDLFNNQFSATSSYSGYFREGDIYPNASVECAYNFMVEQIPDADAIKSIGIKYQLTAPNMGTPEDYNKSEKTVIVGLSEEINVVNMDPIMVEEKPEEKKSMNPYWKGVLHTIGFIILLIFGLWLIVEWMLTI